MILGRILKIHIFKEEYWNQRDGSTGKLLAMKSSGPEFGSLAHTSKFVRDCISLWSLCWKGGPEMLETGGRTRDAEDRRQNQGCWRKEAEPGMLEEGDRTRDAEGSLAIQSIQSMNSRLWESLSQKLRKSDRRRYPTLTSDLQRHMHSTYTCVPMHVVHAHIHATHNRMKEKLTLRITLELGTPVITRTTSPNILMLKP